MDNNPSHPDGELRRYVCTESDTFGFITRGQTYSLLRYGNYYRIPDLDLGFGFDYFIRHFG